MPGDGSRTYIPVHPVISTQYRKVTPSALAAVNRKLAGAATVSHKRQAEQREDEDSRPVKRKKPTASVVRTTITKVNMSANARQILSGSSTVDGRRSSRPRVPSLKLRESEPPGTKTRVSPRRCPPSTSSLSAVPDSPDDPLPALLVSPTTPTSATPASPKSATPKSLAVAAQPRDANGRFGKKAATNGRFMRKAFMVRKRFTFGHKMLPRPTAMKSMIALDDDDEEDDDDNDDDDEQYYEQYSDPFAEEVEFGEEALEDVVLKRTSDSDLDDSPRKRIRISEDESSDISPTTSPRFIMGRGSLLRPNPISFARRKWAVEEEEPSGVTTTKTRLSSDTTIKTERVHLLAPAAIITSKHADGESKEVDNQTGSDGSPTASAPSTRLLAPAARIARLTFRPSPMNLAMRRWASSSTSTSDGTTTRQSSLLRESTVSELAHAYSDDDALPPPSVGTAESSSGFLGDLVYPDDDSDPYGSSDEVC